MILFKPLGGLLAKPYQLPEEKKLVYTKAYFRRLDHGEEEREDFCSGRI